ncbi:MAG: DUF63 family protein, partial [Candidatus Auribacterota bacterium]|nr:DUF63 family protein [Candidatus Auribacterota bacterium]
MCITQRTCTKKVEESWRLRFEARFYVYVKATAPRKKTLGCENPGGAILFSGENMVMDFIQEHFIDVLWQHQGYNMYNTLAYAGIALITLYVIYLFFKKYRIKIDKKFFYAVIPFVLLGSTLRVVTDSIDDHIHEGVMQTYVQSQNTVFTPIYQLMLDSHIYDYGYFTVTPGIYIVTATIFLLFLIICHFSKKMDVLPYIGLVLWLPHFILLLPLARYLLYPTLALTITAVTLVFAYFLFQKLGIKDKIYLWVVGGHALDGAATFATIDIFNNLEPVCLEQGMCYGEQHVLPSMIG